MSHENDAIADCVNRCKSALEPVPEATLYTILAVLPNVSGQEAKNMPPKLEAAGLRTLICHHICDSTYSQGGGQNSTPPGDHKLDLQPARPKT